MDNLFIELEKKKYIKCWISAASFSFVFRCIVVIVMFILNSEYVRDLSSSDPLTSFPFVFVKHFSQIMRFFGVFFLSKCAINKFDLTPKNRIDRISTNSPPPEWQSLINSRAPTHCNVSTETTAQTHNEQDRHLHIVQHTPAAVRVS